MRQTNIVFLRPISEFCSEDVEKLSSSPSLFAVGVIGEMVRPNFSKTILEVVWVRPWVCRGSHDRWEINVWLRLLAVDIAVCQGRCNCDGQTGSLVQTLASQIGSNSRRGSQRVYILGVYATRNSYESEQTSKELVLSIQTPTRALAE